MQQKIFAVLLVLIGLMNLQSTAAEVTNEDIRGTIQSLIYSYNQLDNKLERHEHRERALGELLKKAIQSLQKGQKNLEPINGIFARLDERVSQIETMLITQEEKYNTQTEKLDAALEDVFNWMRENSECLKRPPLPPGGAVTPAPLTIAPNPINEEFVKQQKQINSDVLQQMKTLSANVEKLLGMSQNMIDQTEALKNEPSTVEMLTKIEDKLISYSVATPAPVTVAPLDNSEFENKVLEKFGELSSGLAELRAMPKVEPGLSGTDKEFIHGLTNDTLGALEQLKVNAISATESAVALATTGLKESEERIVADVKKVFKGVTGSSDVLDKFYSEVNASYVKLNDALEIFTKFNNILLTNSEYVLSTQRKVEFGTVQIVQKIGVFLDKQRENLEAILKERFDSVEESVVNTQIQAVQNLSSIIEAELSQVWRQINIMHDEINLLSGRNDAFVNNTLNSVTSMSGKVENIKERIFEVDENLNFFLGKIGVISQEFRNIKVGLSESLAELRHTFQTVQNELPTKNPGPHTIPNNEYETEVNLLNKRHTTS